MTIDRLTSFEPWHTYSRTALVTDILSGEDGPHTDRPDAKYPRWDAEEDRLVVDFMDDPDNPIYVLLNHREKTEDR